MPGPITGGNTFGLVIVQDGDLNVRGATSTTTGISIGNGSNTLRLVAGNLQLAVGTATSFTLTAPTTTNAGFFINVAGIIAYYNVGGVAFDHSTDGASTSTDGTEDTLYTDTLPAGGLSANNVKLHGYYQVVVVGHVTATARTRLYFGGTVIFDTAAFNNTTNYALTIRFEIIRVSSTVVRCCVSATCTATLAVPVSTYTEITGLTLSATQEIKLTGVAASTNAAAGDITAKLGAISWAPAADIDGP